MRTITLEVPEELANELEALPIEERNNFAISALWDGLANREEENTEERERRERKETALAALARFGRPFDRTIGGVSPEALRRVHLYADDPHKDR
jgi:hypothetical protein